MEMFEIQTLLDPAAPADPALSRGVGLDHPRMVCQPQPFSDSKTLRVPLTVDKCPMNEHLDVWQK